MVEEQRSSLEEELLRAEIAVLRGTVAALRTTRASAVDAARTHARATEKRTRVATTLIGFAAGVAATVGGLAIYGVALCP